jgi:hypothetical protein
MILKIILMALRPSAGANPIADWISLFDTVFFSWKKFYISVLEIWNKKQLNFDCYQINSNLKIINSHESSDKHNKCYKNGKYSSKKQKTLLIKSQFSHILIVRYIGNLTLEKSENAYFRIPREKRIITWIVPYTK